MVSRVARSSRWMLLVGLVVILSGLSPVTKADSGAVTLGDFSRIGPALTALNGRLYLAWTGTDSRLNVMSSFDGVNFGGKVILGDSSIAGPALAAFNGRLYLAWTGTDNRLNVMSSSDGASFSSKAILGDSSIAAPALATFNGRLYLAWTGTDGRLNVMSSLDGINFGNKITLGESSIAGPALAGSGGALLLAWTGTDNRINIISSSDGMNFTGKATLEEFSIAGLALASSSGGTSMAWTGTDSAHSLNVIRTLGSAKEILADTSIAAPALGILNNQLYIAWTGTDGEGHLNIRSLTLTVGSTQTAFNWQWPDLSVTGMICIFGVCQGSVNQTQNFPADLADGVQRLGIQSSRLTQGNLPSSLSFSLNMANRTATLNGTISGNTALQLIYDLLNGSGAPVGTLKVAINILLSTGGSGGSGGSCCTLSFEVLVQGTGGILTRVTGVPLAVNGVTRATPFSVSAALGAAITMQAPTSITLSSVGYSFKEWRSSATGFLSNRNPLTGRVDRSETIQAIYGSGGPGGGGTVSLTIRAINQNNDTNLSLNIATSCCGPVTTPATLTLSSGTSVILTAPSQYDFPGPAPALDFQFWLSCFGIDCLAISDRTLTLNNLTMSGEVRAVYR